MIVCISIDTGESTSSGYLPLQIAIRYISNPTYLHIYCTCNLTVKKSFLCKMKSITDSDTSVRIHLVSSLPIETHDLIHLWIVSYSGLPVFSNAHEKSGRPG